MKGEKRTLSVIILHNSNKNKNNNNNNYYFLKTVYEEPHFRKANLFINLLQK